MRITKITLSILIIGLLLAACSPAELVENIGSDILEQVIQGISQAAELVPSADDAEIPVVPEPESELDGQEVFSSSDFAITWRDEHILNESDDPAYSVDILYPVFEGTDVEPINHEMVYLAEVIHEVFINSVEAREEQRTEDSMAALSTLEITYEVTYADHGLISVYLPVTTYLAIAAHPATESFSYNYDLTRQTFLMPDDLFIPGIAYPEVILTTIESVLIARDFGYQPGSSADVMEIHTNWNVVPEGLRINFDAYQVGPGAAGPQLVVIPWAEIAELVDLEGPAGHFISE